MSQFRTLTRAFLGRFFDNEMTGGSNDLKASFIWLISFLAAPGGFLPMALTYRWGTIVAVRGPAELRAAAQGDVVLFIGLAMVATAVVSTLVWNALLLDHRDGVILGAMPVRGATIVRAKLAALGLYVGTTIVATTLIGSLAFGFLLADGSSFIFAVRNALALFATTSAACGLVFAAVVGAQGTLLVALGPRRFARLSPLLQAGLVGAILVALLALPTISGSVVSTLHGGWTLEFNWESLTKRGLVVDTFTGVIRPSIVRTPPLWFLGLHEWLLGSRDPFFKTLAANAVGTTALALTLALASYPLAYRRLMTSVVEQSAGFGRVGHLSVGLTLFTTLLSRQPEVRAISTFFLTTVVRVERHRLVMAVAVGAALAWGLPTVLAVTRTAAPTLDSSLLGFALVTSVFLIAGLRVAASLPSDLRGSWLFDVHRPSRLQIHVALERTMLVIGVAPITIASALLCWHWFDPVVAALHAAFTIAAAALLIQILLWRTDDVPCAAAWQPERANMRKWWPAYFLVFLFFAEALPSGEVLLVRSPTAAIWITSCLALISVAIRRAALARRVDRDDDSIGVLASALHTERRHELADDDEAMLRGTERHGSRGSSGMFGSTETITVPWRVRCLEAIRELARIPTRLPHDTRMALRRLLSAPVFTVFSIGTLALSIGATTAVYSVMYSMAWRDLGVRDVKHVIAVTQWTSRSSNVAQLSWPDFQDLSSAQTSLTAISGWSAFPTSLTGHGRTTLISGQGVSGNGFDVVRVPMLLGRAITMDDDRLDAPPVVVLSESTWRAQFGANPHIVGQVAKLGVRAFDVVGVAPASFVGITAVGIDRPSLWVPLAAVPPMLRAVGYRLDDTNRRQRWITAIGRVNEGIAIDRTSTEVSRIGRQLDASASLAPPGATTTSDIMAYRRQWHTTSVSDAFAVPLGAQIVGWFYIAVPALVLLVACTNLANLVLSRGASRRQEFAIRQALGNSRAGVIRELLVEHSLVAGAGAGIGLIVAHGALMWLEAAVEEGFGYLSRYRIAAHLEPAVIAAAVLTAVIALIISGLMPAIQLTRGGVNAAIAKEGGIAAPRWRGRRRLIAAQVATSVCLLVLSALFVREFITTARKNEKPGLDRIALVKVSFGLQQRQEAQAQLTLDHVIAELSNTHGIQSATATNLSDPRLSATTHVDATTPDKPFALRTDHQHTQPLIAATPGIWRTLGISMRSGRAFDETDIAGGHVAVVDEAAARQIFGTAGAAGRTLLTRAGWPSASQGAIETWTIVGVAANSDVTDSDHADHRDGVIYVPLAQHYEPDIALLARSSNSDVSPAVGAMRTALRHADPDLAVTIAGRADVVSRWGVSIGLGLAARIAIALTFLAIGLAMAGLYGVLSHVVERRTRELGVRVALGAEPDDILRVVMQDGLRPVVAGLGIGLVLSAIVRMALQPQFPKPIGPLDITAFAIAMLPMIAAALVACYLPARRAARVSPATALKDL